MSQTRLKPTPKKPILTLDAKNKRFLAASVILHLVVAIILFSSWQFSSSVEIKELPSNIQARVLTAQELDQLRNKKLEEQKALEKKRQLEREKKQKEKQAKQREKEAQKKKAEQKRKEEIRKKELAKQKEEARKKALIQKKEKEQKKKEKKRKEQEKQRQLEAERLKKEAQEKAEEQRLERERRLEERLKAADEALAAEQRLQKEREMKELLARQQQARQVMELEEKERFMVLIRNKIENRWHIPPKIRNKSVLLRIRLLPNGELSSVNVIEDSGSLALDQSALNAVQSILKFPVPEDKAIFEKYFRQFSMRFSPEM